MPNQNMQGLAGILAEQGRNGDTMLMHVAPSEVEYLAGLGGITENPVTGLPEAFKFKDLLPFVGSAFLGPAFKAVGFSPGVSNFLATTASTMLGGGSFEKGIMSGLVSSSIGRLGQNLADTAAGATPAPKETGYKFGIFKKPETGTFGSRYSEAFQSPEFNPVQMVKAAGEAGLDNLLEQIQKPSVMIPFTVGAGELGRIKAEEDYARQYQNFLEDQAERRRRIRERTPQILPPSSPYYRPPGMAQGGKVQRKFDGYSFDPFSFDEYIPDAIMPGDATPVGVGSLTPLDEPAMPSEEWFLWSDGTYNRLPEETGIRTPYDQLPDTYKAQDARGQQPEAPVEANRPPPVQATTPVPDEPYYAPTFTEQFYADDSGLIPQAPPETVERYASYLPEEYPIGTPMPVRATTPLPEEPVYQPPAQPVTPPPVVTEQELINNLFVSGADVPQSTGINEDALYNLGALLSQPKVGGAADVSRNFAIGPISVDPNVAGTALSGEAFGVTPPQPTSPPPPATEQDLGLSQAEIDAITANFKPLYSDVDTKQMEQDFLATLPPEEKKAVEQMNDYSQFLQNRFNQIREALAAKDFEKAFDLAISGDKQYIKEYNPGEMTQGIFTANLMRTSDISQMTGPMTEEDIRAYYEAMPVNEVIPLLYPGAKVGDYVYTLDKNKAMQQDIANLRASGGTGFPSAANQVGMKSTKQNLTIPLIAAALAFAGVPYALGDAIASSSIGAKLGLAGLGKAGTTALGSAIIGASGSALQGGSFEDALKAGLMAAGFSFIAETALGEIKEAYNNWAFDNLPAGEQVANTLVTVADPSNVIVTAVNQANNIAQSVTQTAAQLAAQQVSQPEVKVETTRDVTKPSVPTPVAPPPAPTIQTPLDQVTVTTQQQQPQQPNVPVVVTPPAPPAPPPPPPVIETPLDQVTVTTQQPTTQQPNVPVVVPPPAPPVLVEPPLDQVTVTTSPTTQDRVDVPVVVPPPAPPPVVQTPLDQVTVTTSPTTQDRINVPVVVPPPAPPTTVQTPLDQVTVTTSPVSKDKVDVPVVVPPPAPPPAVQTPLDQVTVTTSPTTDDRLNVPTPVQPPPTPVELTAPVEEVVVSTKPTPKDELNIPTPTIPLTTPVTPPVEPVINTPDLLETLKEKGKDILTDAAISQLLGALAGGGAGGGAGAGAGGGGYAGTGGLGYIPEGFGRRYIGAPEDYRHGFLPEFLFFENLNPPAVDLTAPGSTPGTTPGTRPGNRPEDPDIRIEPKAAGGKIKSYSPRGYLDLIQGYSEGGEIEDEESIEEEVAEYSQAPMTDGSRGLIQLAQAAILGQLAEDQTDDVIQKFIDLHGNKAFRELREKTLESVANGSRKEGMIEGHTGGMDDMVEGVIGSSERVAVSPGEFIIPADVVSMLGDGNSDSGRTKLEQMMSRVRKEKTGSTKQAKPINSAKVLPA